MYTKFSPPKEKIISN